MKRVLNLAEDVSAASRAASSSLATPLNCPPVEELLAWWEYREEHLQHGFSEHVKKCPRCAHIIEQAASPGTDAGFEDQDLLALQPGLRMPASKESRVSTFAKSKIPAAKVPAATWELLTGRMAPPRKS